MYFVAAVDICTEDYAPVWNIVGLVVNIIKIGVPIALILLGMIDLGKAVIASKEDEVKKATKLLGKRFLYAVGVFASVWIVTLVLDIAADTIGKGNNDYKYDEASWKRCWALINGDSKVEEKGCYKLTTDIGVTYEWQEPSISKGANYEKVPIKDKKKCLDLNKSGLY